MTRGGDPGPEAVPRAAWVTLFVVLAGSYGAVLNTTVTGVALSDIARDLTSSSHGLEVDWVVSAFLIGVVFAQPAVGWIADAFGRKLTYSLALTVFGVGSVLCAVAPTMLALVAARLIQGIGAGAILPIGMTLVTEAFPRRRRGTAMGFYGIGVAGAPAAGVPIGGLLVSSVGWRALFVVFIGLAVLALALSMRFLPRDRQCDRRRFDVTGWILASVVVVVLLVAVRQAPEWGLSGPLYGCVAGGVVGGVLLVLHSLRIAAPIIDFRMFANWTFNLTMLSTTLISITQYARLNFLAVELEVVHGHTAQYVGLLLAPSALGVMVSGPLGGWLTDRIGSRTPVLLGFAAITVSMWMLGHLDPTTSPATIIACLVLQGVGIGMGSMPLTVAALNSLPSRFMAQGSALTNLNRQFAGALGVAIFGAVLVQDIGTVTPVGVPVGPAQDAFNDLFMVAFWISLAGLVSAVFLPGARRTAAQHAERHAEDVPLVDPQPEDVAVVDPGAGRPGTRIPWRDRRRGRRHQAAGSSPRRP